jgi:hypothetical protein
MSENLQHVCKFGELKSAGISTTFKVIIACIEISAKESVGCKESKLRKRLLFMIRSRECQSKLSVIGIEWYLLALFHADDIYFVSNVLILKGKENKQSLVIASKKFGPEINSKKANEVFVSHRD